MNILMFNCIVCVLFGFCISLNILVIWHHQAGSHFRVYRHLFKPLAQRKHNVTVISYFPQSQVIDNYKDISLRVNGNINSVPGLLKFNQHVSPRIKMLDEIFVLKHFGQVTCENLFSHPNIKKFLNEKKPYDLVLTQVFTVNCQFELIKALNFRGPVIGGNKNYLYKFICQHFSV